MAEYLNFKKSNCKNCYKCIRHCPVKAIRFSGNQAHIISDECILCGHCIVACPQNAKQIADGTELVEVLLESEKPIYASVAPSFVAYFEGVGIAALTKALKALGFAGAEETAVGATLVKREYEKQLRDKQQDVIITSCCHSVNLLIEKYYPALLEYLSPVVSPMVAHTMDLKRRMPECKTVFIGPCLSKKDEAEKSPVDAVLTFEELARMLEKHHIVLDYRMDSQEESRARLFPTSGGILKTMDIPDTGYTPMVVDGMDNCCAALADIAAGRVHRCFIEMSACAGSCIGGPVMEKYKNAPIRHYQDVVRYAGKKDFAVESAESGSLFIQRPVLAQSTPMPSEKEITDVLKKMGKTKPEDELNCGTCGYNTCRDKAIAVCQGKADVSMCLPYLMEKTERFSNSILNNAPIGVLVVNEDLEVQKINRAAMNMLRIRYEGDALAGPVVNLLDPLPFLNVMDGKMVKNQREYYADFGKYLELTVVQDKAAHILIALLRDVTEEEAAQKKKSDLARQTVEITDKVVDKQMRIVQEIASLLGETTAETKIALTKLKESMTDGNQ